MVDLGSYWSYKYHQLSWTNDMPAARSPASVAVLKDVWDNLTAVAVYTVGKEGCSRLQVRWRWTVEEEDRSLRSRGDQEMVRPWRGLISVFLSGFCGEHVQSRSFKDQSDEKLFRGL